MDDEVHRSAKRLRNTQFLVEPVFGFCPIFNAVGNIAPVDDEEKIEVGLIALGGVWFINPATARLASVQDDLEDTARLTLAVTSACAS